jgi:hypothetical protein
MLMAAAHNLRTLMRIRASEKSGFIFVVWIFSTNSRREKDLRTAGLEEKGGSLSDGEPDVSETDIEKKVRFLTAEDLDMYQTNIKNSLVLENVFRTMPPCAEAVEIPFIKSVRENLPKPHWEGHREAIECYWRVWELAFGNTWEPTIANGFLAPYIDCHFMHRLFMWDTVFIMLYAKYARRVFDFQCTLDNFYARQHLDGWICRELRESDGKDAFARFNPSGTGPNILPWGEWEYFNLTGNRVRLARVFPVLVAYHRWLRLYQTWPDGTYWTTGWGSGMDNQPRICDGLSSTIEEKYGPMGEAWYHDHMVWVDACIQQFFSAKLLLEMGKVLGRESELKDMEEERRHLERVINGRLWSDETSFYHDQRRDGSLSKVKSIAAYWALIAGVVPEERLEGFVSHLENPSEFKRSHRVPTLSADHPDYRGNGSYWRGGVWAPTNYMVLRGLTEVGRDGLAHEIAMNHLSNVVQVFERTGHIWENYAPESASPGAPAKRDYVGWSGLAPVAVLFEYVFGLRPDMENQKLVWDVRLLEEHGVSNYPFGREGVLDLHCGARSSAGQRPDIRASSNVPLKLEIRWEGGTEVVELGPSR